MIQAMVRSTTRSSQVASGLGGLRTKCAQIIGVSVSDTTIEMAMAKASVTENSRNTRPITPVMNNSGMKAATSETLIETTVKPICRAPSIAAITGVMPFSRLRKQFSIITMASSTTKPTDTTSAISDRLLIEKPATHIIAQVPASASGTVTPAAMVAAVRRKNRNTTSITSAIEMTSVSCMSNTLARIVAVRSDSDVDLDAGGNPALQFRQHRSHAVDGLDHVGVGRLGEHQQDRGLAVEPAERAAVAHAGLDRGDGGEADHGAVGRPHHDRIVL